MSDEVERRIEEARQKAQRVKETEEFIKSLGPNDEIIKPVYNPQAWVIRDQLRAQANRGDLVATKCRHPLDRIIQIQDQDPTVVRKGVDVNLFECGVCHMNLWLVDPWGVPVSDS